ncbi:endonuclease V [Tenacibaculum sp. M341]|uniref:endonuclease V n=1 Tax=Tenacibaculum sp. M341 TaxID=2530339 RepID=UPI0010487A5B|nr:endonuclease V [Tenacibaculum sp. M341]TCI93045.1 endonuclease V [Tenacibaculum sp. M341]
MTYCIINHSEIKRKEIIEKYPIGRYGTQEQFSLDGENLFSGVLLTTTKSNGGQYYYEKKLYIKGEVEMEILKEGNSDLIESIAFFTSWISNGYELDYYNKSLAHIQIFDMNILIESNDMNINNSSLLYNDWDEYRESYDAFCYSGDRDVLPYYNLQNKIKEKTIREDSFDKKTIRYIAGVDIGYDELDLKMVGSIVVYDLKNKKILQKEVVSQDILFNYCNDLFSYREIPLLKKAFDKLNIQPDLLLCKGHGIAHPRYVGLATHLGVELNIPSIGCSRDRVLGIYKSINQECGSSQDLIWKGEVIGKSLRIKSKKQPIFISIGHKISLETAHFWCKQLYRENIKEEVRLPYPLVEAEKLVDENLEDRTHIEFIKTEN